jgi:hypothetical protein
MNMLMLMPGDLRRLSSASVLILITFPSAGETTALWDYPLGVPEEEDHEKHQYQRKDGDPRPEKAVEDQGESGCYVNKGPSFRSDSEHVELYMNEDPRGKTIRTTDGFEVYGTRSGFFKPYPWLQSQPYLKLPITITPF